MVWYYWMILCKKTIMNIFREHKQIPHNQIPDLAQARAYQHDEPYPMNKAPFTSRTPSTPTCGQGYSTCKWESYSWYQCCRVTCSWSHKSQTDTLGSHECNTTMNCGDKHWLMDHEKHCSKYCSQQYEGYCPCQLCSQKSFFFLPEPDPLWIWCSHGAPLPNARTKMLSPCSLSVHKCASY